MNTIKIINSSLYGVSGNSGMTGKPGVPGFRFTIGQLINEAIKELKIEEKYSYSSDIIVNSKDLSPIYAIKLYNDNENHIIMINDDYEFYSVNKIKTHIKHYFRDINLNKLIQ